MESLCFCTVRDGAGITQSEEKSQTLPPIVQQIEPSNISTMSFNKLLGYRQS
ncbi:MAG: hypothetical protein Ct9H300mP21_05610 [Pseudomonadota bacterium]|nr:MAG: hypothetical protein Ct9H300mP21_05610 [Pseudomonadota bacterium]